MTSVIVFIEIIEEVNVKILTMWLEKKFLLDECMWLYCMPLLQIKNFFIIIDIIGHEVFQFGGSMSQGIVEMWYT